MIIEGGGDTGGTNKKQPAMDATGSAGSEKEAADHNHLLGETFKPAEKTVAAPTETEKTTEKAETGDNSVEQNLKAADKVTEDLSDTVASKFQGKSADLQNDLAVGGGAAIGFLKDQNLRTGMGGANAYLDKGWENGLKKAGVSK